MKIDGAPSKKRAQHFLHYKPLTLDKTPVLQGPQRMSSIYQKVFG